MRISILYTGEFGAKVAGNLVNPGTFCTSCGDLCDKCRGVRASFGDMVYGIHELPTGLPEFIEEPGVFLPEIGTCDLIIAMGIHPDLLAALPVMVDSSGAKAVIVPVEEPGWAPLGLQKQLREKLESKGVECEFPKPFCALAKTGKPVIDEFVEMGFGRPELTIRLSDDGQTFTHVDVLRDAPCGCTWFVAKKLKWSDVEGYKETVSEAHHAYPCTGSMERDTELGDTILHEAGYIIRDAVEQGMRVVNYEYI
ncbi:MAG: DUF166 domain-containing protein [ANME-2 cluster archaeon]|nr:DUF166 domain-containing protein [ANME-2 cluster archaeon]